MYVNSCQGNRHHLRIIFDHHPTNAIMYIRGGSCYDVEAKHACDHLNHYKDKPNVKQLKNSGALLSLNTIKIDIFINIHKAEYTTAADLYQSSNVIQISITELTLMVNLLSPAITNKTKLNSHLTKYLNQFRCMSLAE